MNKIGAVFSGQGSQYVGMGKEMYDNYKIVRDVFQEASEVIGRDVPKLIFSGSESDLVIPEVSQALIVTLSVSLYQLFRQEYGVKPAIFAGHSLGEYSALVCSGVLSFEKALQLVKKRGIFFGEVSSGGTMAAIVDIDKWKVEEYCNAQNKSKGNITVSNYNSKNQNVISGSVEQIDEATEYFTSCGAIVKKLNVRGAYHSPFMLQAAENFKQYIQDFEFSNPMTEIICNVNGQPYISGEEIKEKLIKQIVCPVRWSDTMDYFVRNNINTVIEFGPKKALRNFFRNSEVDVSAYSYDDSDDREKIKQVLTDPNTIIQQYQDFAKRCLGIIACTKNRNTDAIAFSTGVIERCKRIREIKESMLQYDDYTLKQCKEILELTKSALDCKKVAKEEQEQRIQAILNCVANDKLDIMMREYLF